MDLARIIGEGVKSMQKNRQTGSTMPFFQRFEIAEKNPFQKYQTVDHIEQGYRRSVCGVDNI